MAAEKEENYSTTNQPKTTYDNLNPEQFEAVQRVEGPSLIVAGPGTGKTKTLTGKIAWLIGNHHAQPEEILAITFTNKAAGELKERLEILLKNKTKSGDVTVSTFHAFGLSILKEFYAEFNRNKKFILVDENLKREIIKSMDEINRNEAKKLSTEISEIKKGSRTETEFFKKYESELQKLNAFDLDDLIEKPLQLFSQKVEIAQKFRKKFRYIFVDEYQDTNDTQYKLLRLLAHDSNANLCVVGDANQSIYGFRGANTSYIKKFTEDYPKAKIFRLTRSYRCSQTILTASSNVIEQESEFLKGLNEGVQISISKQPTGAAEAEFIARQIVDLVGGVSFFSIDSSVAQGDKNETINSLSDLAVLCRTRNQFEAITKALRDHHVPYQENGTGPFFRQEPFQNFSDILGAFLLDTYEFAAPIFKLKKQSVTQLQFELAREEIKKSNLVSFLNFIKENYFSAEKFTTEDWNRFVLLAEEIKSIDNFMQLLKLGSGTDTHDKNMEAVSVMTLHASKGLEFECVFIPGCEEGLLPYNLYKNEVDVEEEKRLLYVGMTRAKKLLYLTSAKSRTIRGRKFNLPKSPFLDSIQQELIQQIKNNPPKKSEEKDNQLSLF
jgi:DNA helicase II / ATP-dependent DNA helicase PcrA